MGRWRTRRRFPVFFSADHIFLLLKLTQGNIWKTTPLSRSFSSCIWSSAPTSVDRFYISDSGWLVVSVAHLVLHYNFGQCRILISSDLKKQSLVKKESSQCFVPAKPDLWFCDFVDLLGSIQCVMVDVAKEVYISLFLCSCFLCELCCLRSELFLSYWTVWPSIVRAMNTRLT